VSEQYYYLIAFDSTHAAINAEKMLKKVSVKIKLVPLPSIVATGCGFGIKVLPSEVTEIEIILKQSLFEWSNLYKLTKVGNTTQAEKWELVR
jgi:hypothetical protein